MTADKFYNIFNAIPHATRDSQHIHSQIMQYIDTAALAKFAEMMFSKGTPAERKVLLENIIESRVDQKAIASGVPADKRTQVAQDLLALPNSKGDGLAGFILAKASIQEFGSFIYNLISDKQIEVLQMMHYRGPEGQALLQAMIPCLRTLDAAVRILGDINVNEREPYYNKLTPGDATAVKAEMTRLGMSHEAPAPLPRGRNPQRR